MTDKSGWGLAHSVTEARILIVDDNGFNRSLLAAILAAGGFNDLHMAVDGREALEAVMFLNPDMVILDLLMPGMDGYAVTRALRGDPRFADLPILVQTALGSASQRGEAFQAGATDLVIKPVDQLELLARVSLHLQNRQLICDLRTYHERTRLELDLAQQIYRQLLPSAGALAIAGSQTGLQVQVQAGQSEELGGSLWGVAPLADGRLAVQMLDMAERGVTAALDAIRVHALLDAVSGLQASPGAFLAALNRLTCGLFELGHYASAMAAVVDARTGSVCYASAAAAFPVVIGADDTIQRTTAHDLPLGVSPVAVFTDHHLSFPPGALLLLGGARDMPPLPPLPGPSATQQARSAAVLRAWAGEDILSETSVLCVARAGEA